MPCICSNSTLRLFIRNVAQLDVPVVARRSALSQIPRQRITPRNYAHTNRLYSSAAERLQQEEESFDPLASRSRPKIDTNDPKKDLDPDDSNDLRNQLSYIHEDGAIVDFSAKAINETAAEATAERASGTVTYDGKKDPDDLTDSSEQPSYIRKDDAIVNFSAEAIDEIAAEAAAERAKLAEAVKEYHSQNDTPLQSLERERKVPTRRSWNKPDGFKLRDSDQPDWQKAEKHGERLRAKREREAEKEQKERDAEILANKEPWMIAKAKVQEKYPDGWNPLKRLSPDAIAGIRALHAQMPTQYTPWVLANEFKVSTEAIQRILRTKWRPDAQEQTEREQRWHKRGEVVWSRWAEMGHKPPAEWRELGIGNGRPDWMKKREGPRKPRTPLPALITSSRRREVTQPRRESAADSII